MQVILSGEKAYQQIESLLTEKGVKRVMLVCDPYFVGSQVMKYLQEMAVELTVFSGFSPNPKYEEAEQGLNLFHANGCEAVISAGGGSAMDVAKGIKLFCKSDLSACPIGKPYADTGVMHIAIPTTAGTGSESTRHAVLYLNGVKQSISHPSIVPDVAVLEPTLLKTLPVYQRKCTLMDAFCQAIESFWSVSSTDESRGYSEEALKALVPVMDRYVSGESDTETDFAVMKAANLAGRAINITATTAAHAMSYKLSSLYRLPHGHAVALSMPHLWRYFAETDACLDSRGRDFLNARLGELCRLLGVRDCSAAADFFDEVLKRYELAAPHITDEERAVLVAAVNPERLGNFPVPLTAEKIDAIYRAISC